MIWEISRPGGVEPGQALAMPREDFHAELVLQLAYLSEKWPTGMRTSEPSRVGQIEALPNSLLNGSKLLKIQRGRLYCRVMT